MRETGLSGFPGSPTVFSIFDFKQGIVTVQSPLAREAAGIIEGWTVQSRSATQKEIVKPAASRASISAGNWNPRLTSLSLPTSFGVPLFMQLLAPCFSRGVNWQWNSNSRASSRL